MKNMTTSSKDEITDNIEWKATANDFYFLIYWLEYFVQPTA